MMNLNLTPRMSVGLAAAASFVTVTLASPALGLLSHDSRATQTASLSNTSGRAPAGSSGASNNLTGGGTSPGNPGVRSLVVAPTASHGTIVLVGGAGGGPTTCGKQIFIEAGTFDMGRQSTGGANFGPGHTVSLDAFTIDKFEVTNQEYVDYLNDALAIGSIYVAHGTVYSENGITDGVRLFVWQNWGNIGFNNGVFEVELGNQGEDRSDHPVVDMTWFGACDYANDLSLRSGLTPCYDELTWSCDHEANGFRLPTEAEWEYAARGGLVSPFVQGYGYPYPWVTSPFPHNFPDGNQANYFSSGDPFEGLQNPTSPVGYYDGSQTPSGIDMANGFGLYDMAGNVQEWCGDLYGSYGSSPSSNPTGATTGSDRVTRGGSWLTQNSQAHRELMVVDRSFQLESDLNYYTGFRLVRTAHLTRDAMVSIPSGTFDMGRHLGTGQGGELPVHTVTLDAFWMDQFEVTCQEYVSFLNSALANGDVVFNLDGAVCQAANPTVILCDTTLSSNGSKITLNIAGFDVTSGMEDHPIAQVSWFGACAYANAISIQRGLTPCYDETDWSCDTQEEGFRLPTESEWEYAARGGEYLPYTIYPFGDTIDGTQANFVSSGDPFALSTPVGYYDGDQVINGIPSGVDMANGFGLYDMSGNVLEWCGDRFGLYSGLPSNNPTGPTTGSYRVLRGGSFYQGVNNLRSAKRESGLPSLRGIIFGFRLVTNTCQ
jgi:formylglycine-generating enzyme required for sulfatase activity